MFHKTDALPIFLENRFCATSTRNCRMPGILSVSSFCGLPLETGALIIGYFNLCLEIPAFVYFIICDPMSLKLISICMFFFPQTQTQPNQTNLTIIQFYYSTVVLVFIDISWVLGIYRVSENLLFAFFTLSDSLSCDCQALLITHHTLNVHVRVVYGSINAKLLTSLSSTFIQCAATSFCDDW